MKVITPESDIVNARTSEIIKFDYSLFLAGTIDNGYSNNWQDAICSKLDGDILVCNPRREHWNTNASIKELQYQIAWEQQWLHISDLIVMVLLDDSKSPISLMELGEFCSSGKLIVFCTKKFYRYWNVKDLCLRKGIRMYETNDTDKITEIIMKRIKDDRT